MKKLFRSLLLSLIISAIASISTLAYGWVQDSTGWRYQREYGGYIMNQWFQDPSTGYTYHFNTFGYMDVSCLMYVFLTGLAVGVLGTASVVLYYKG